MDQATVVCVRLRPASSKETGVRCIRPEGEQDVMFTNPDRSLSSYGYDKVYGALFLTTCLCYSLADHAWETWARPCCLLTPMAWCAVVC
jgi:hypothetical protein